MPSQKCLEAIEKLLPKDFCPDRKLKAQIVMCKARGKVEKGADNSTAMKEAWQEVKKQCGVKQETKLEEVNRE